ncbi:unnamed protein product [Oncorhynchus mykiss]|uniref:Uncharacterized protein n=1 Tax=Oncorhynchus mykiss TaxID=8022 RepID=A0A060W9Y4_ONCMY|nr:unnamed protein product [Oncorhynchus mykiss]
MDLIHKYGRVCGYYLGRRPVVVVADPDMLRQIMVKDFSTFPNRMVSQQGKCPLHLQLKSEVYTHLGWSH